MLRIAILTSHPVQYYAPWFSDLNLVRNLAVKVFYLWDFGVTNKTDPGFKKSIQWDIPLLSGYEYEFVPNVSSNPGTHHFWGLQNPSLITQVKAYAPDAVLLMNYNYASLYNFLLRWDRQHTPILFRGDSHRLVPKAGSKELLRRTFISALYQLFSGFLYVGKANYEYFAYHYVPEKKLFFSPHAVDNQRFFSQAFESKQLAQTHRQELNIPEDDLVVLFAGKFESKKRPLDLIQAFLQAKLVRTSLVLVGDGSLESEMRKLAANHPDIHFLPFQNQTLMPTIYAMADVVVLPSYGAWETWGLAVNEAMCMERPVIVSTHVGCAQNLVEPYRNGLVFSAGDVAALATSLQEACADRDRLKTWGKESRKIITQYSYARATQGLLAALDYLGVSSAA